MLLVQNWVVGGEGGGGEVVEGEGRRDGMRRIRRERDWKRRMNPGGRNEKEGEGREH